MDTPGSSPDHVSSQTVTERPARPIVHRTLVVRLDLRAVAAFGAGLIVLAAFLPWVDPSAQALIGDARVAPVIQGWPSLFIGLIALGALALPHTNSSSAWVSLPAAALGLAAAFIAVVSAMTTANVLSDAIARFPATLSTVVETPGAGIYVTIAGGILCVVAGLSHPSTASSEAHLDLRLGQPDLAIALSSIVIVVLVAGLVGAWMATSRSGKSDENPGAVPSDLLSTPVIDAQVAPLGATAGPAADTPAPPSPPPATRLIAPPTSTPPPTNTQVTVSPITFASPTPPAPSPTEASPIPTAGPSATPTPTPTTTPTTGSSPLVTPQS